MSSRKENMKKNVLSNLLLFFLSSIMSFVVRSFFIKILGETCLGLNSLYTNILSMLSLSELGLSTAIGFSLYKKLANKSYDEISIIMSFYKKVYYVIGTSILIVGLIIIPFIPNMIKGEIVENYQIIFIIYLLDTAMSYFASYKDILIESDQKKHKIVIADFLGTLFLYLLEIIVLKFTNNFILYALTFLIMNSLRKIVINIYITKKYDYIDFNSKEKMSIEEKNALKINVKAMMFHKISEYLVNSTDNIIISKMINLAAVGFYVNYLSLISILKSMISTIYSAITSSVGNLLITEEKSTQLRSYRIMEYVSFVLGGFFTICFYNCANSFVEMWIGNKYILSNSIVLIISLNFYFYCILLPVNSFKAAAGLYNEDKYYALLQAIVNLIVSIILTYFFGLIGVLIGTTISYVTTISWIKPYIIYKHVFKENSKEYFLRQIKNIIMMIIVFTISILIINNIAINSNIMKFLFNGITSVLVYTIALFIFSYKTYEFKYLKEIIKNKLVK